MGDFGGLGAVRNLDLSSNDLTALPAGLFDELFSLRTLHLHDNAIFSLPVDIFDRLFVLETLTLHGNAVTGLPEGMFDDLSRFEGVHVEANTQGVARLAAFLEQSAVTSVEGFIEALPDLHKQRFVFVYESGGLGAEHISSAHPRVVSWGANGEYVFAWVTNPEAPEPFKDSVEFLIPGETAWTAGVIDFSGDEPEIAQPAICSSCHGAHNKPLFTGFDWPGTEYHHAGSDVEAKVAQMDEHIASPNLRIALLDLEPPEHSIGNSQRLLKASEGAVAYEFAVEEASKTLALRHAEVLLGRLKARDGYEQFAADAVCGADPALAVQAPFTESREHTLGVFANSDVPVGGEGALTATSVYRYDFRTGALNEALLFLVLHDLWETHPAVRDAYRATLNTDAANPYGNNRSYAGYTYDQLLLHPPGAATAEDELLQLYRVHFGYGNRALLQLVDDHNPTQLQGGSFIVDFKAAHTDSMAPRVCAALELERIVLQPTVAAVPQAVRNLSGKVRGGRVALSWDAPEGDPPATGYRILRGLTASSLEVLVTDTSDTATAYVGAAGSGRARYFYSVKALNETAAGPAVEPVQVGPAAPEVIGATTFTVVEGDTAVGALAATDADTDADDLVWWIAGGADRAKFTLSAAGMLAFAAPKDFENPDDAGRDGAYNVVVRVKDGTGSDTADVEVAISDRNEAPTADAGDDQRVAPGATVTLTGSGADPDAGDTLTYGWTQTGGDTVTLSDPAAATTTFTAPTQDTPLDFTLTVTDPTGLQHQDQTAVTVAAAAALTAWAEATPYRHNGRKAFTFELHFSEQIRISYKTVRDEAFEVTGGAVLRAKRRTKGSNLVWTITVKPRSRADVMLVLPAGRACGTAGAVCTADGRALSNRLELTVPGPAAPRAQDETGSYKNLAPVVSRRQGSLDGAAPSQRQRGWWLAVYRTANLHLGR